MDFASLPIGHIIKAQGASVGGERPPALHRG